MKWQAKPPAGPEKTAYLWTVFIIDLICLPVGGCYIVLQRERCACGLKETGHRRTSMLCGKGVGGEA